ncbi:hypothetical protein INT48_007273, partial [Thamnidium elegans]
NLGLQEQELNLLHEEADTLSNYLMSEGYDLITDLGCVVGSSSTSFAWHRDSDYYQDDRHRDIRSIACWTALDSVTEHNGTIEIRDFLGTHHTICAEAGTIVYMSDQLVHKSTCNLSSKFRRVYMNQFSASPLYYLDSDEQCVALAVPSPFQNSLG